MTTDRVRIVRGQQSPGDVDRILRSLPDWFGIEDSIVHYVEDAARLPTYLAYSPDDTCVGVLLTSRHFPESAEVHLMAVDPTWHRRGVGRTLLGAAESDLASDGVRYLQVKTQGPSADDPNYAQTLEFYRSQGFNPLEEIDGLWPGNPCLILVKTLDSVVVLREITDENRAQIEALAVTPTQDNYVGSVTDSLLEAAETPGACPWYRAVYAGQTPVGFVMISDNIPPERTEYLGPYYLWRLLVDARFQGRNYGRQALDLAIEYIRQRPNPQTLLTSYVPGEDSPLGFYLAYGFHETGDLFEGEPVLTLAL